MDRDEALNHYLLRLRKEAGLSLEQVCQRTKIQDRYVTALEEGRFGELPSNTHLRAFSLAIAQACNGDEERAAMLVRRVLVGTGAAQPLPEDLPAPASAPIHAVTAPAPSAFRAEVRRPAAPLPPMAVAVAVAQPEAVEAAREAAAEAAEGLVQGASQRLKALPWQALLGLAAGAALLSGGLLWGLRQWQGRGLDAVPELETAPSASSGQAQGAKAPAPAAEANAAGLAGGADAAAPAPVPATQLVLRARRPCWLVLQIDGQRLPTVTLEEGEKRSWPVTQKAVLLAGNIGALRVWWRGDNLGYLGELSTRQNGLVFEPGKAFRVDKASELPLPAGVPE